MKVVNASGSIFMIITVDFRNLRRFHNVHCAEVRKKKFATEVFFLKTNCGEVVCQDVLFLNIMKIFEWLTQIADFWKFRVKFES